MREGGARASRAAPKGSQRASRASHKQSTCFTVGEACDLGVKQVLHKIRGKFFHPPKGPKGETFETVHCEPCGAER